MRRVSLVALALGFGTACTLVPGSQSQVAGGGIQPVDPDPVDPGPILPVDPTRQDLPDGCEPSPSPDLALCGGGVAAVADGRPFTSISEAFVAHTEALVCPGLHDVSLTLPAGAVLRSASGDPRDTVLTGGGSRQIAYAEGAVSIRDLTFEDGWSASNGGAVEAAGLASLTCVVVRDSYADYEGGGAYLGAGGSLDRTVFVRNEAGYSGGALAGAGGWGTGSMQVLGSLFANNVTDNSGGALELRGDATLQGSTFADNQAGYEGGAVHWGDWEDHELEVADCAFTRNAEDYSGGAIEIGTWAYDVVGVRGSTFVDNTAGYVAAVVSFGTWGGVDGRIEGNHFEGPAPAIGMHGWLQDGYTMSVTGNTFLSPPGSW